MSNVNLTYAISKRTPPTPKTLKAILDLQAELNRAITWTHERLALAPAPEAPRASLSFPFVRITPARPMFGDIAGHLGEASRASRIDDASVSGSTRVKGDLWNAHCIAAFLRHVSQLYPELLLELRDDGGFVLPGAVTIRGGNVELNREELNRARERVLEMTGDPQSAAPFVWAEAEALGGNFFVAGNASDFAEVPEIQELGLSWDRLQSVGMETLALRVVERALEPVFQTLV